MEDFRLRVNRLIPLKVRQLVPLVCFVLFFVSRIVVKQAVEVGTNAGIPSYETSIFLLLPWMFLIMTPISLYLSIQSGIYRRDSRDDREKEYLVKYYSRLREIPCQICELEDCSCDSQMQRWVADIMPFIHSPLLKEVIDSFQSSGGTEQ